MAHTKNSKIGWLLLLFSLYSTGLFAKINPQNGSVLSQVHIMFEWDDVVGADMYELTVYRAVPPQDIKTLEEVFTIKTPEIAWLATQKLAFGNRYLWEIKAFRNQKRFFTSQMYEFKILESPQAMPDSFRSAVQYTGTPNKSIIFLDRSAMAIDKKGKTVWFLPVPIDSLAKWTIRDLKLTPYGTITHVDLHGAYEKDLTGKILWQAPDDGKVSGSSNEEYHHELKKNNDGTYTVEGSLYKTAQQDKRIKAEGVIKYNTIIQYNAQGEVIWSWSEWNSLQNDSLFKKNDHYNQGGHLNGFTFTKDNKKVFMSFKNLSNVYLYDKENSKFITSLKSPKSSVVPSFQQQHGPFLTKTNELMIYNNNIAEKGEEDNQSITHPAAMIFKYDPITQSTFLIWQYEVKSEKYPEGIMGKEGYVSETKEGTILICAGGANYAVEVNRKKQKVWEAYFYYRTKNDTTWKPYSNYRCQSASSLYPLYFTLQYAGNNQGKPTFRLYNAGSEAGSFELLFLDEATKKTVKQKSKQLQPGQSQLFQLSQGFYKGKGLNCDISPMHIAAVPKVYSYGKL